MRCTSTRVLPLPAPASTSKVPGGGGDGLALGVVEIEEVGDIHGGIYQRRRGVRGKSALPSGCVD